MIGGLLALSAPTAQAEGSQHTIGTQTKPAKSGAVRVQSVSGTSHITGTVTTPTGDPADGVDVYPLSLQNGSWDYTGLSGTTLGDGTYDVTGLPAGTYRIQFEDYGTENAPEFYNDKTTAESADDVVVGSNATVSGIDAQLGAAGHIVGRVVAPDGTGLDSIDIYVIKKVGSDFEFVNMDFTDENGYYNLGLAPGSYRLYYSDEFEDFASEFYNNAVTPEDATDVTVVAGSDTNLPNTIMGTTPPNVWKSTAKVTVSAYRHGNVSVSCTKACSGYAQVWSDAAGTLKSSAKYFSLTKAGYKTLAFTDLPYVNSTTAKVRLYKKGADSSPNPQFNKLQLVKGPQNVVKTTATVKVSSSHKATVNISCTMACEGYVQLRSDEAGTLKSANVYHYKLSKAGYMPMYFTGVPHINSTTWLSRVAPVQPSTSVGAFFRSLHLIQN